MTLQIQETKISGKIVEILIANAPTEEQAKEWVRFSFEVAGEAKESLAEHRLKALRRLQDIVHAEIQSVPHSRDHRL